MQNWNDLVRTQLNNLASFPAKQTWKLGEWTYECHVRPEVANFAALPLVGNELGDVRVSLADQAWYIWDGAAWQSMGGGGGGAVNSVTASAPIASSGGANPNISLTGIVAAANGGTGLAAAGAVGNVLTSTGAGWASSALPASVTSVSGAAPLASSGGTTPTISLTGIVAAANGGTGIAAPGVLGNVLTSNGAGAWTSSAPASTSPAAPLTSVQFNNAGAFGGSAGLTWNGSTLAVDGAVDRATAGTLTVGGTTATAITVGSAGITTSFPGPVNLTGDVTTVGGTQFTTDATFDGNVTFGNAASDNISFVGQVDTAITQEGIAAPAVSPASTGRIYFDSGSNTFKASQNGGAYVDIITGGTVTSVGASSPLSSSGGVTPSISFPSWPVNASGALTNDGAGNLTWTPASGGTITGSGTATQIAFFTGASAIGSETAVGSNSFTWDATNNRLGVGTSTPAHVVDVQAGSLAGGGYALNVDATLTNVGGTVVSYIEGSVSAIVPVGTPIYGVVGYLSGAGVPSTSYAGSFGNVLAGSGQDPVSALQANFALQGSAAGTTASGHNVGVMGLASNGARNYAVFGNTTGDGAGANVAVTGMAKNSSGIRIGGLFASQTTGASQPTVNTSAVLIADNMDLGDPIFLARDNGTTTFSVGNNGVVLAKNTADSTAAFDVQNSASASQLRVDTTNSKLFFAGVATTNTHTVNIGTSGTDPAFAIASGGRIHYYDGSQPTNGQVLIGDTASGNFAKAAITAGTGISVTNGAGSITIAATGAAASSSTDITGYVAQEALNAGDLVRFVDDAGTPKVQKADATNTDARLNPVGFAVAAASAGAAVTVRVAGVADVPAARFDAAPGVANVGQRVFVSTTSGQITITAPSASGDILQRVGVLVDGSANPKVLVQVGDPTLL